MALSIPWKQNHPFRGLSHISSGWLNLISKRRRKRASPSSAASHRGKRRSEKNHPEAVLKAASGLSMSHRYTGLHWFCHFSRRCCATKVKADANYADRTGGNVHTGSKWEILLLIGPINFPLCGFFDSMEDMTANRKHPHYTVLIKLWVTLHNRISV